jgi:hypothetical protein
LSARARLIARVIEPLDGLHQADVALLNEVDEREATAIVAASDGHHESEVRLDELVLYDLRLVVGLVDPLDVLLVLRRREEA